MNSVLTQAILQERNIAYAITDGRLTVLEVNGAAPVLGEGWRSAVGRPLTELVPELAGNEAVLADILAGRLPRFQLALVNRDREGDDVVYLTIMELPYWDAAGRIAGILHVVEDVTEMGTLEQHLAQRRNELRLLQQELTTRNRELAGANAELQRLDELKSMFVSIAAHELRTPLSAMLGYLEMLLDEEAGALNEVQRDYLEVIEGSARRLHTVTSELLDVTRIEAGRVELVLQATDLAAVVETAIREVKSELDGRQHHLALRVMPELPPALCDRARAVQIVGNLLSNATKYTLPGGRISVAVGRDDNEGFLHLSVADTGVGIPPEDQARIFERFFRAQSATLADAAGAGMGLYITRSLVELNGGRIWFESRLHHGSTFHVMFPIAEEPLEADEKTSVNTPRG